MAETAVMERVRFVVSPVRNITKAAARSQDIPMSGFHVNVDADSGAPLERNILPNSVATKQQALEILKDASVTGDAELLEKMEVIFKTHTDFIPDGKTEKLEWYRLRRDGYMNAAEAARRRHQYYIDYGFKEGEQVRELEAIDDALGKYQALNIEVLALEKELGIKSPPPEFISFSFPATQESVLQ